MANVKEFLYQELFSTSTEAMELFSRSIGKAVKYDAFGGRTVFNAIVLTKPVVLAYADIYQSTEGWRSRVGGPISKFAFKARIIDDPSPHGYIPDPCVASISDKPNKQLRRIFLHTTFISSNDYAVSANSLPKIGDLVKVELTKNVFSYDMSFGKFLNITNNNNGIPPGLSAEACSRIDGSFGQGISDMFGHIPVPLKCKGAPECGDWVEGTSAPATAEVIYEAYKPACSLELAKKIVEVANKLSIKNPGWLANAIQFESKFNPAIQNDLSAATGLIQFMPGASANKVNGIATVKYESRKKAPVNPAGTTNSACTSMCKDQSGYNVNYWKGINKLLSMSAIDQMDKVYEYFKGSIGKLNSQSDIYMAIFFPYCIGKGPSCDIYGYYLKNRGVAAANNYLIQNKGIRTAGDYTQCANSHKKLPC